MSLAELPCYTIINVPSDFETPNEIQLKNDLEKGDIKVKRFTKQIQNNFKVLFCCVDKRVL